MSTLGTMIDRIGTELQRSGKFTSEIGDAIRSSIQHYETMRTPWTERREYVIFHTVAGQRYYSLSSCSLQVDTIKLVYNERFLTLTPKAWSSIDHDDSQVTPTQGAPTTYAIYGQSMRVFPVANASYTTLASGLYRLASLTGTAQTNNWLIDTESLIRERAKQLVRINNIKDPAAVMEMNALVQMGKKFVSPLEEISYIKFRDRVHDYQSTGRLKKYAI
jgi:hypothetical protein